MDLATTPQTPLSADKRADIRRRYLAIDTSNVADVLDQLGYQDQGLSSEFAPYPATSGKLCGWAYTIRGQMLPYEGTGDAAKMQAANGIGADDVSVWSGDGAGICYFGELIALGMKERGSVGALIDGGIRDVRWIGEMGFPVYARYRTPVQSIGRWRVTGCGEPVYLRGATTERVIIDPGDFILADEDGAIVIPSLIVLEVLESSEALTATEQRIRSEVKGGLSLQDALAKFGHV
jgi:4-hydroxy-4-methyl-2-oxoglutarate aldolase